MNSTKDIVEQIAQLPGVAEAIETSREACSELRWHNAMRKRSAEVRAEAVVQAARASAALDGARMPVELVRDASWGGVDFPDDPVGVAVAGALRANSEADRFARDGGRRLVGQPRHTLAALHVAAATGLVDDICLGRPRMAGEDPRDDTVLSGVAAPDATAVQARLEALWPVMSLQSGPALVAAAIVLGEVLTIRPFVACNGVVARATFRSVMIGRALDPMGACLPELAMLADPQRYAEAVQLYREGTSQGLANWVRYVADMIVEGATFGHAIADSVLIGRYPRQT